MVDAYRRIPAQLRKEKRAGAAPDEQLVESLGKVSTEIDSITRQLADGALDDLAIRTRYLDYRYGEFEEPAPEKN
jgi:HEPN domain-containing protein